MILAPVIALLMQSGSGLLGPSNYLLIPESASAPAPWANNALLYAKDKAGVTELYYISSDGTEHDLSASGGTPSWDDVTDKPTTFPPEAHQHVAADITDLPEGGGSPCDAWPVGSVFISTSATNPGTSLGCGTWSAFGAGRVLVGIDAGQTEFDVAGETGGAKTHTLTEAQIPSHTHVQNSHNHTQDAHTHTQNSHNHTQDPHTHTLTGGATDDTSAPFPGPDAANAATVFASTGIQAATATNQAATATNQNATATNQAATATNQNTGGGTAHPILQPYLVVHMFTRTE